MLYNVLIRRLVTASEESRSRDEDIADRLVRRCVEETDLIRQTLMNAVCDPRFKMHVGVVRGWKRMAMEALHNLVGLLLAIPVHNHVMGDSHNPRAELPACGVFALLKLGNDFHERLLEDIISHVIVADNEKDIRIKLRLIA